MAYNITLEGDNMISAERMLKNIAQIFNKFEIEYWIEGGTLLGIRRENRLLPWDNDIDFSVKSTQIDKKNECRINSAADSCESSNIAFVSTG